MKPLVKKSTILIIILVVLILLVPLFLLAFVIFDIKKQVNTFSDTIFDNAGGTPDYVVMVDAPDTLMQHSVELHITTARHAVPQLSVSSHCTGIDTRIANDTIYVTVDSLHDADSVVCVVDMVLPRKSDVVLQGTSSAVPVCFNDVKLDELRLNIPAELSLYSSDFGLLLCADTTAHIAIRVDNCNVGVALIDGSGKTVDISSSDVGMFTLAGDCQALRIASSNIGMSMWTPYTQDHCTLKSTVIGMRGQNDVVSIDWHEDKDNVAVQDEERESGSGVFHVQSGSDRVEISGNGIFVETPTDTVRISGDGVYIRSENKKP